MSRRSFIKSQPCLAGGIDGKIILPSSPCMSYRSIRSHIAGIYGLEIQDGTISSIPAPPAGQGSSHAV